MNQLTPGSDEEKRTIRNSLLLAGFLVVLDQLTKFAVVHYITLGDQIKIVPGVFNLTYITNRGAAWGIFSGYGYLLLLISILVLFGIIFFLRSLTEGWWERYYCMFMIISGIIGNSIDRVWRHEVVDFLDFYIGRHHWPAFNVADSAITVGVTIFIISSLKRPQNPDKPDAESTDQD